MDIKGQCTIMPVCVSECVRESASASCSLFLFLLFLTTIIIPPSPYFPFQPHIHFQFPSCKPALLRFSSSLRSHSHTLTHYSTAKSSKLAKNKNKKPTRVGQQKQKQQQLQLQPLSQQTNK